MTAHVARSGQLASIHAFRSFSFQNVLRPMRMGCGIRPAACHVRQVRGNTRQNSAASFNVRSIGADGFPTPLAVFAMLMLFAIVQFLVPTKGLTFPIINEKEDDMDNIPTSMLIPISETPHTKRRALRL
jgi:hypothetical protein